MAVEVIIVKNKGSALLVETIHSRERFTVPRDFITETGRRAVYAIEDSDFDLAIPYGISWEEHLEDYVISKEDLIKNLKDVGIWTVEDYLLNPSSVLGAISASARPVLHQFNEIVDHYRSKES
jgi:hypothetical protein